MDALKPTSNTNEQLQSPQGELHLKFDLGTDQQLAFPAIGVMEVVELPAENITPMPNMNPLLMGTCNLRGEILWLVDLALLLQKNFLSPNTGQYSIIVVQDEEAPLGLAVANIRGMSWLDTQQIRNVSQLPLESLRPFVRGSFPMEDNSPVLLLDPDAIIRAHPWID